MCVVREREVLRYRVHGLAVVGGPYMRGVRVMVPCWSLHCVRVQWNNIAARAREVPAMPAVLIIKPVHLVPLQWQGTFSFREDLLSMLVPSRIQCV
jgi:hypothetical protein